jgi:hypothetical protein
MIKWINKGMCKSSKKAVCKIVNDIKCINFYRESDSFGYSKSKSQIWYEQSQVINNDFISINTLLGARHFVTDPYFWKPAEPKLEVQQHFNNQPSTVKGQHSLSQVLLCTCLILEIFASPNPCKTSSLLYSKKLHLAYIHFSLLSKQ